LREIIPPREGLLPVIRKAGERLIAVANLFEFIAGEDAAADLEGEDAPAETVSKTKRGKRASKSEPEVAGAA
jgi:hypothetical protein